MARTSIARGIGLLACCIAPAAAQSAVPPLPAEHSGTPTSPSARLSLPMSLRVSDHRLADVLAFIHESSGARLEPLWIDDRNAEGLDPDARVTVNIQNTAVVRVLEQVLAQVGADERENTWQLAPSGACQLGPRARLNRFRSIEVYRIDDLLSDTPEYTDAPEIDLQSVLQAGGSGGSRSPFRNDAAERPSAADERDIRAGRLAQLIQETVEPEQWVDAGGSAATVRAWDGMLVVNAPGYIHRQIGRTGR